MLIGKVIKWLCVAVLGVMGFSACSDDPMGGAAAYGSPTADYKYMGTVTDEAGNPIEGINVIMSGNILGMPNVQLKTESYNGEKSNFSTGIFSTADTHIATIDFVDVDGEENGGEFEEHIKDAYACHETNKIEEGDGSWYSGGYEVKVGDRLEIAMGSRTVAVEVLQVADNVRKDDACAMYKEV